MKNLHYKSFYDKMRKIEHKGFIAFVGVKWNVNIFIPHETYMQDGEVLNYKIKEPRPGDVKQVIYYDK